MGIRSKLIVTSGLALSSAAFLVSAHAQTSNTTIAAANEATLNDPFVYNSGTSILNIAAPINLNYTSYVSNQYTNLGSASSVVVSAVLQSFTAYGTGVTTGTDVGGGNIYYSESFSSVSGTILTTNSTGSANLLSFTFTAGNDGTSTTSLTLTETPSGTLTFSGSDKVNAGVTTAGDAPGYTSDFMKFLNPNPATGAYTTSESFSLGLTNTTATPASGVTPGGGATNTATFNTFTSDGSFTFNSTPLPQGVFAEPSAIYLSVMGAGVSFAPILRRKRARKS